MITLAQFRALHAQLLGLALTEGLARTLCSMQFLAENLAKPLNGEGL